MFVKRHKLESELIKSAAEGLGFSYTELVRAKRKRGNVFCKEPVNGLLNYVFISQLQLLKILISCLTLTKSGEVGEMFIQYVCEILKGFNRSPQHWDPKSKANISGEKCFVPDTFASGWFYVLNSGCNILYFSYIFEPLKRLHKEQEPSPLYSSLCWLFPLVHVDFWSFCTYRHIFCRSSTKVQRDVCSDFYLGFLKQFLHFYSL